VVTERALLRLQTYQAIRDGILSARYHPGVLRSEQQLAAELQVNRTPVREAIKQLEHQGLVSVVPTRGIFVHETTAGRPLPSGRRDPARGERATLRRRYRSPRHDRRGRGQRAHDQDP
jgi:DNA-binding FadR family transcriptional regulator